MVCSNPLLDASSWINDKAARWQAAAVVVGMHPDEATEPVVVEALAAGKPFAVVPCCVFPKLFPHRRTAAGKLVTTHAESSTGLATPNPFKNKTSKGSCNEKHEMNKRGLLFHELPWVPKGSPWNPPQQSTTNGLLWFPTHTHLNKSRGK